MNDDAIATKVNGAMRYGQYTRCRRIRAAISSRMIEMLPSEIRQAASSSLLFDLTGWDIHIHLSTHPEITEMTLHRAIARLLVGFCAHTEKPCCKGWGSELSASLSHTYP